MKAKNKIIIILLAFIAVFANKSIGQEDFRSSYIFTSDSVAGFDETSASAAALTNGCYGKEFKVYLYNQKRDYVKQKYNLKTKSPKKYTLFQNPANFKTNALAPGGACNNEDFELATAQINAPAAVQGWSLQSGSKTSCAGPVFNAQNNYTVFNAPTVDPKIPGQVSSYFDSQLNTTPAGNCFIKLNNALSGAKAIRLSKAFIVNANNALFQYAYLPVIQDGTHACCEQPGFNIEVTVTNTVSNTSTVLACPNISIAVPGAGCPAVIPPGGPVFVNAIGGGSWKYSNWTASAIDLSAYLNFQIQIDVTVVDCIFSGHGAYVYFDAKCAPMTIIGNGNPFPAGTPSITLPTCGATGASIVAPAGLGPYSWAGPGVNPPFTTPSMTNQTYTTNISANYTLTMNPAGSCFPITRVITVSITPAPQIVASVQQAPCGGTIAVASCTTAGSASVASTIVWSPNPVSINASTTQATYTIGTGPATVTATDPLGCTTSATVNINNAPPVPTLTITNVTGSNSITCATPSINYIANSNYTNGPLTYTWVSLSGTATGTNVTFTTQAVYTVTATDPNTNCSASTTFTIGFNQTNPTSTVNPVVQNIVCGSSVVATFTGITTSTMTNITHSWFSPWSPGAATNNGTVSIQQFLAPGVYTYVVTNNINGCSVTKTVNVTSSLGFPLYNVSSPQSFTIGCGTTSVALISVNNVTTSPSPGGTVTYTVLPPSFTGPTYTTGLPSTFTANIPGQYTVVVRDMTNNCETKVPISIISNTFQPQLTAIANNPTLTCYVPKTLLQGTSTNSNVSFSWAFPGSPGQTPNDTLTVFTTTAVNSPTVATYTLTITDNLNLCKSTQTMTIYQDIKPPLTSIAPTGTPVITCTTPTISLTNNSSTAPSIFFHPLAVVPFSWSGPSPQVTFSNTTNYIGFTPGTYTMVAIDLNNGCKNTAFKTIIDNRIYPIVNTPNAPSPFILDCAAAGATIAPIITGTTTGFTYAWGVVPTASFSCYTCSTTVVNKPGEYNIFVTNPANGCVSQGQVQVVNGALNGDFTPSAFSGYAPLAVTFQNLSASTSTSTPSASITSVWSFGNGVSQITNSVSISPTTTYTNAGTYTVTMYVNKGTCLDTVVKIITVELPSKLEVPNVFTPNGDGSNDVFFLKVANITDITANIFDRWGNKVYESTSTTGNIAWDGKNMAGKELPVGTYFYVIKATGKDETTYEKKGNVSLYR